ncbi:MAG: hypothetical protein ACLP1X_33845 [Polyangiaceae bacterium]|jgi:hypothetical protein
MENKFFFPEAALNQWIVDEVVDVQNGELTILGEGRRYRLAEAVRVVREVSGTVDGHDLVGRVKARTGLDQLGAEIVETSMLLGDAAYDVEPGWVGTPLGTFAQHEGSEARKKARAGRAGPKPTTDEELLARFLDGSL